MTSLPGETTTAPPAGADAGAPPPGDAPHDGHDHGGGGTLHVELERRPGSEVALTVEAAAADVDAAVTHALRHLAQRYRFPGFRPGKAPAAVVERAVGWPVIAQEAVETLVPSVYGRALDEAGVVAVGDPKLDVGADALERGRPFTFRAVVTVRPEVDLGDYRALRVEPTTTEVDDAKVDAAVEAARRRRAALTEVDRGAQAGDVLRAVLHMRHGGDTVGGTDEERDVELDREVLLPGLADVLLGLAAGQTHSAELVLPDDYANEALRGSTVTVDVEVRAVRERTLPPLDDAFAVAEGHGETVAELREWYRERLSEVAERQDAERFEGEVLERLVEGASVDVPAVMVDREIGRQLQDMELRLAGSGLRLDRYLEYTGQTMEQLRASRREGAERRVRLELVLQALAAAEALEIDEADVEREELSVVGDRKLTRDQRRRVHLGVHHDLLIRAAAQRALEIARGEV